MANLIDYGFARVGRWKFKPRLKSGIAFELSSLQDERVIYAFVAGGEPNYIGICEKDSTSLKERMRRYQSMQGAGTNERIAKKIRASLEKGQEVEIAALKPEHLLQYHGLRVDLVKGLENPLIRKFRPEWNRQK